MIGERTAEQIKMNIGTAYVDEFTPEEVMNIKGRDLVTGLPKVVEITNIPGGAGDQGTGHGDDRRDQIYP